MGAALDWAVRYVEFGQPGFCAVTEEFCRLVVEDVAPVILEVGAFVLLPATPAFTMAGSELAPPLRIDPKSALSPDRKIRHGRKDGPADVRQFGGWFSFDASDAGLLVSLLPRTIHIQGALRLAQLVRLLGEDAARDEMGRGLILAWLVEILLIEALRAAPATLAGLGLLRGLADSRIAVALRGLHAAIDRDWTIPQLADTAGMSCSAFFDRFSRTIGLRPMGYLLTWGMSVAKSLLRAGKLSLDGMAEQIDYGSASTFSTAVRRHVGMSPRRFMRAAEAGA